MDWLKEVSLRHAASAADFCSGVTFTGRSVSLKYVSDMADKPDVVLVLTPMCKEQVI